MGQLAWCARQRGALFKAFASTTPVCASFRALSGLRRAASKRRCFGLTCQKMSDILKPFRVRNRVSAGRDSSGEESNMRLSGRTLVVTGASSGFGRATAVRVAEEGAQVVIVDLDNAGGEESVRLVEQAGGEATLIVADVATQAGARCAIDGAIERFGVIDVLVNNAGVAPPESIDSWDASEESWDRLIRVNLKSVFLCSKVAIPVMIKNGGGSIVNVASIAATRACSGASYASAKAGMLGYTVQVASELAARGVRVNCVSPGFMRTPMSTGERHGLDAAAQDAQIEGMGRGIPMRRVGTVQDIAAAVAYLASDDACYVTGQEIIVDGGFVVAPMWTAEQG
jgi:NAD(P)-dependent dehydrogenase (short-subunit alcohol dehydrogenase family)